MELRHQAPCPLNHCSSRSDTLKAYFSTRPKTDVPAAGEGQGAKSNKGRDKPLTPLERHLVALLPESSGRIEAAIGTLGNVIDVRDGGQHSGARGKGAVALAALGVGYPPRSWPDAWNTISAKAIEALDAIREELATLSP